MRRPHPLPLPAPPPTQDPRTLDDHHACPLQTAALAPGCRELEQEALAWRAEQQALGPGGEAAIRAAQREVAVAQEEAAQLASELTRLRQQVGRVGQWWGGGAGEGAGSAAAIWVGNAAATVACVCGSRAAVLAS